MINVTVGEQKPQSKKPFPKLMKCIRSESIKLVFSNGDSLQVTSVFGDEFKYYKRGNWNLSLYTDFNEPITLQNA